MSNGSARASPGSLISRGERQFPALAASARLMYTEWLSKPCDVPETLTCLLTFNITAHNFQSLNLRFT